MAVKLRLTRVGKKKQPSYRLVAADSRSPRDGRFIEIIGTYAPRSEPSLIKIDGERALHWLRHGAKPSARVEKLLKLQGIWDVFEGKADESTLKTAVAEPEVKAKPKAAKAASKKIKPEAAEATTEAAEATT